MAQLRTLGSDYPIRDAIKEGLANQDCYEKSPEMCRYVLWRYEEHLARELGSGASVDDHERNAIWRRRASDSVEHILPQNPWGIAAWTGKLRRDDGTSENVYRHVGRIGNLVLLPVVVNQQAQTKPFTDKKTLYAKHNLRMIKEVCDVDDWTFTEIDAGERRILEWAETQWADV